MKRTFRAAGASDVGCVRAGNEDDFLLDVDRGLFAVADGMGGHASGEVASGLAIDALREVWAEPGDEPIQERLHRGFQTANHQIRSAVDDNLDHHGMGTTLVAVALDGDTAQIANVGDSRLYLLRDGVLRQVTQDHSWVEEQVHSGNLSEEEASQHPFRNVITRALGTRTEVEVDHSHLQLHEGDRLLLCSDGLTSMLEDERIMAVMHGDEDLEAVAQDLIEEANEAGGEDNVTVIVVEIHGVSGQPLAAGDDTDPTMPGLD